LSRLRTLEALGSLRGKRVLVRCDFNVPMADGAVTEDLRIRAAVPTIRELLDGGAAVVACSHLGRPKGHVVERLRMAPVGVRLGELLDATVPTLQEVSGAAVTAAAQEAAPGSVTLLENLRFDPREEANNPVFAAELAELGDAYVDDAFGAAHRAHASVEAVAHLLPAAAGRLVQREVEALSRLREDPGRPFVAILGGAKISDKLRVVNALIERVDALLVGGAMAFSFLAAQGLEVGASLVEPDRYEDCLSALAAAQRRGVEIVLPSDVVVAPEATLDAERRIVSVGDIPRGWKGLDVGPSTSDEFGRVIGGARTVFWNGPMGVFELEPFAEGTRSVASAMAICPGFTVAGGGDSIAALAQLGLSDAVDHLSTGGGASLEFVEGRDLPGLVVLTEGD
jgi:phosphoglycerate kinase